MNAWRRRGAAVLAAALLLAACAAPPPAAPPPTASLPAAPPADLHPLTELERRQLDRHVRLRQAPPPRSRTLAAAAQPMVLAQAAREPDIRWNLDGQVLTLDDYLRRQPVTALLVARGDQILVERYAFGRSAAHHFLSNSMAKSVAGLGLGLARAEGRLTTLEQPLQALVPALAGTAYGETTLRNLMRMGSGVKYLETYEPGDDSTRFGAGVRQSGIVQAARGFDEREAAQGTRFNYASIETALAGAALRAAVDQGLAEYLGPRLWQAIGAEAPADWLADPTGLEMAHCCLYARPRDWLRLGLVLAHDGRRPDTGAQVFEREFLLEATDWRRFDPPFRPRAGSWGYSHFFWVLPGPARRFALLGVHGQAIFVDPAQRLVMVHLAAAERPRIAETTMARERFVFWQGLLRSLAAPGS